MQAVVVNILVLPSSRSSLLSSSLAIVNVVQTWDQLHWLFKLLSVAWNSLAVWDRDQNLYLVLLSCVHISMHMPSYVMLVWWISILLSLCEHCFLKILIVSCGDCWFHTILKICFQIFRPMINLLIYVHKPNMVQLWVTSQHDWYYHPILLIQIDINHIFNNMYKMWQPRAKN